MRANNIRVPSTHQEAWALGFMVGYTGKIPEAMEKTLDWIDPSEPPAYMSELELSLLPSHYREGYEEGCVLYGDHNQEVA